MRKLWSFPGGLDLDDHKAESTRRPVVTVPLPRQFVVPVQQHIGEATHVLVSPGERVRTGQPLTEARGYVSAPVHATGSGTVSAVEERKVPHPSGLTALCVVIDSDGEDEWVEPLPALDPAQLDPLRLRQRVRECGLVGLGGAAFPTAVKLNPGPEGRVDQLILNGAECEPWITADEMLMRTRADEIIEGAMILSQVLQPAETLIGVEDNKPEAIEALRAAAVRPGAEAIEIVPVPARYPAGGEKQLIQTLTGKEVPADGIPMRVGVICHNVGTAVAIRAAVLEGRPLVSRLITVTGEAVAEPRVVEARIGTPIRDLAAVAGGFTDDLDRLIMGGPMMGFALDDDSLPVVKATNCILAGTRAMFPEPDQALPCIRCGACSEVCPASLLPQQLYYNAHARDFDRVQDYSLFDCIECGACAYVCPSHIPLVQYFRFAKTELWAQERDRRKADIARERHEFRTLRLEREEAEKKAKREAKKAALKRRRDRAAGGDGNADEGDDRKAAIDAALERAREKKARREPVQHSEATATDDTATGE